MSEALLLLDRMASRCLESHKSSSYYLDLSLFHDLDWLEQKNIIRYWFSRTSSQPLALKHYEWILSVLLVKGISRKNAFSYHLSQGELAFYQGRLYYLPKQSKPFTSSLGEFLRAVELYKENNVEGSGKSLDSSQVTLAYALTISEELLSKSHLIEVRSLSQDDDLKRNKLKSFFQANSIPVWERKVWPVLVLQGELVGVLGCYNCLISTSESRAGSYQAVPAEVKIEVPEALVWQLMGLVVDSC